MFNIKSVLWSQNVNNIIKYYRLCLLGIAKNYWYKHFHILRIIYKLFKFFFLIKLLNFDFFNSVLWMLIFYIAVAYFGQLTASLWCMKEVLFMSVYFAEPITMSTLQHNTLMSFDKLAHLDNHYFNQKVTKSKFLLFSTGQANKFRD